MLPSLSELTLSGLTHLGLEASNYDRCITYNLIKQLLLIENESEFLCRVTVE